MDSCLSRNESGLGGRYRNGFGLADQAGALASKRGGGPNSPRNSPSPTLAGVATDLLKLADLQCRLMKVDIREFWNQARIALALIIVGPVCVLAAVPLGLYAIAIYISRALDVPLEAVLLVLTAVLIGGTAAALYWSWRRLVHAAKPLERSNSEFQENLRWMRSLLHDDSAAASTPPASSQPG